MLYAPPPPPPPIKNGGGIKNFFYGFNDILVSVVHPDLFRTGSVSNPKAVKMSISRTLSDLYAQEWNARANVSSKGKQYLLFKDNLNFVKYLVHGSNFLYSKIIYLSICINESHMCIFCMLCMRLSMRGGHV